MATLEQIAEAIKRADAAGNAADVKALGAAYRALEAQEASAVPQDAFSAASAASQMLGGKATPQGSSGKVSPNVQWAPESAPKPAQRDLGSDLIGSTTATLSGLVSGVPIAGPMVQNFSDALIGTGAQLTGGNYADTVNAIRNRRNQINTQFPVASGVGQLASGIGSLVAAGGTPQFASALGMTGSVPAQMGKSALSTLAIGTADSMARGEKPMDAMTSSIAPAALAGLIPGGLAVARLGGKAINENIVRPIMTAANRENEAASRIGRAITIDKQAGATMAPGMEQMAAQAGADVTNADRFGSAIRSLARTASNVSTAGRNIFEDFTQQRFYTQSGRAVNFVKSLMGGATDDIALQDRLRTAAQISNKAAYDAAYSAPKASVIWTPRIQQLMQAPEVQAAIRLADDAARTDAALSGMKPVKNPFIINPDGTIASGFRKQADGSTAMPSLQFWDIVQRELRKAKEALKPTERTAISRYDQLRNELLGELDGAVPQFQKARQGAAAFFGAQDAVEAGRNAFKTPRQTEEVRRAVAKMTDAEKQAFSVGFSSEMIDAINSARDRVNVIESIFGNPSIRERISIALGPQKARELEAYVKMEQTLDQLRVATQGNSTTARQLIDAGVIGGAGGIGFLSSGDPTQGVTWGALALAGRRGLQMVGKRVDEQVMKVVAEALASGDPALVQRAIQNASLSQKHMDAIDGIMRGIALSAKGGVIAGMTAQPATAN